MEQSYQGGDGANHAQGIEPNGNVPAMNQELNNHLNTDTLATSMTPNQQFISDPSLGAANMPDPSLMASLMFANGDPSAIPSMANKTITADEIALYDRQIRLWGMDAQAKIRGANILLITIRALANEIAKNLVLAGIGSLTILDSATITEADLGAQFLLSEVENPVGRNRAEAASVALRKLNPRVHIYVDSEGVKSKGPSYFAGFDVVIATDLDPDSFNLINTATRLNGKAFYAAGTHGMYGFIFSDLIEHDFVIERDQGNVATEPKQETRTRAIVDVKITKQGTKVTEAVTKRELYSTWFLASDLAVLPEEYTKSRRRLKSVSPALSCLRALWDFMQLQGGRLPSNRDDLRLFTQIATQKHKALSLPSETLKPEFLRSFLQNLGSEIAPATAILGGQLAQDVINVLGQKQQPIQNMVIFDGSTMEAVMYPLHPEGTLGASLLSLGLGADTIIPNGNMAIPPDMSMAMNGVNMGMLPIDPNTMVQSAHSVPMSIFPPAQNTDLSSMSVAPQPNPAAQQQAGAASAPAYESAPAPATEPPQEAPPPQQIAATATHDDEKSNTEQGKEPNPA